MMTTTPTPAGAVRPADTVTYREAAGLTGLSEATIERDRKKGKFPNASQDPSRSNAWVIPVADLVAAGRLDGSLVEQVEAELAARRESRELGELRELAIRLEEQLAAALNRANALEGDKSTLQKLVETLLKKVG